MFNATSPFASQLLPQLSRKASQFRSRKFFSFQTRCRPYSSMTIEEALKQPRDSDETDVLIVGGGPAGLAASIRLKQLCQQHNKDLRVTILEKGSEVGNHTMSGAIIDPRGISTLLPDWKNMNSPIKTSVNEDRVYYLQKNIAVPLPIATHFNNHGNYIVSLGQVNKWLAGIAEGLGVEVYSGFAGSEVLYGENGEVVGVATGDMGIGKDGNPTPEFQRGLEIRAPLTLFAEGTRGSLTKQLMKKYSLNKNCDPQTYGIGVKEVWEVKPEHFKLGQVTHTFGFPTDLSTYAGSFMYHWEANKVAIGYVVGLDYQNPWLSPYQEFQQWKTHPTIRQVLDGGKCLAYGARAINEGGYQSIPQLVFPGGALLGCAAGLLNVPKIKGSHNALMSGIFAAESAFDALMENRSNGQLLNKYKQKLDDSWVMKELYLARNIRPAYANFGMLGGVMYSGIDWLFTKGKEPFTMHIKHADHECIKPADQCTKIEYPKPDGKLTFDLMTSVARTGTNHNENQPAHLKLTNPSVAVETNLKRYAGLESRYCPAGVYEFVENPQDRKPKLQINAQNCIHCKTCDIKDPTQNITWVTPEGGGGPGYTMM